MHNDAEHAIREFRLTARADSHPDSLTLAQTRILERAVAKIVLLGEQVGVSIDQMILLLGSGLTVGELVQYLSDRSGQVS